MSHTSECHLCGHPVNGKDVICPIITGLNKKSLRGYMPEETNHRKRQLLLIDYFVISLKMSN